MIRKIKSNYKKNEYEAKKGDNNKSKADTEENEKMKYDSYINGSTWEGKNKRQKKEMLKQIYKNYNS